MYWRSKNSHFQPGSKEMWWNSKFRSSTSTSLLPHSMNNRILPRTSGGRRGPGRERWGRRPAAAAVPPGRTEADGRCGCRSSGPPWGGCSCGRSPPWRGGLVHLHGGHLQQLMEGQALPILPPVKCSIPFQVQKNQLSHRLRLHIDLHMHSKHGRVPSLTARPISQRVSRGRPTCGKALRALKLARGYTALTARKSSSYPPAEGRSNTDVPR